MEWLFVFGRQQPFDFIYRQVCKVIGIGRNFHPIAGQTVNSYDRNRNHNNLQYRVVEFWE